MLYEAKNYYFIVANICVNVSAMMNKAVTLLFHCRNNNSFHWLQYAYVTNVTLCDLLHQNSMRDF